MNSVVEWRATTTARTGRPDRVALCVCVCENVYIPAHIYICACVCVWAVVRVCMCEWVKACLSFHETTKQKSPEN